MYIPHIKGSGSKMTLVLRRECVSKCEFYLRSLLLAGSCTLAYKPLASVINPERLYIIKKVVSQSKL